MQFQCIEESQVANNNQFHSTADLNIAFDWRCNHCNKSSDIAICSAECGSRSANDDVNFPTYMTSEEDIPVLLHGNQKRTGCFRASDIKIQQRCRQINIRRRKRAAMERVFLKQKMTFVDKSTALVFYKQHRNTRKMTTIVEEGGTENYEKPTKTKTPVCAAKAYKEKVESLRVLVMRIQQSSLFSNLKESEVVVQNKLPDIMKRFSDIKI